jgi:hypothetical protein
MNTRSSSILITVFGIFFAAPTTSSAQIRASELASVSQTIDGTVISVEYSRPQVRGRDTIFGGPVYWGEVWTPGANWATTLEFNKPVELNGHAVPEGKYSLWLVVQPEGWTAVLDTNERLFHTVRPEENDQQIRFPIDPLDGPFTEALAFTFNDISATGVTLAMNWDETYVPLEIKVENSRELNVAADVAGRYLGAYTMNWIPPLAAQFESPADVQVNISYEDEHLFFTFDPPPFDDWSAMMLLPLLEDWFTPAALQDGEIFDVVSDLGVEFVVEEGQAVSFEIRAENDDVLATGVRN